MLYIFFVCVKGPGCGTLSHPGDGGKSFLSVKCPSTTLYNRAEVQFSSKMSPPPLLAITRGEVSFASKGGVMNKYII